MDLAAARITMSLGTEDLGAVEDGDLVSLSGKSGWLESRQGNIFACDPAGLSPS